MAKQINFDLSAVAEGGLQEKLDRALDQVTENIMDPNTDQTKKRKITINMVFEPSKSGDAVDVDIQTKVSLVPEQGVGTTMLIGRDGKGKAVVNELKSGTPGQTFIDPDDGEVKTDTGVPVADIEKEQKVIDLQKKKG
ncbi:MAG: replication terminator protein [Liquorilactobacillus hordei]|uniref:replication terminator protein n=1 Tax=Liquorilactobacillus hordei TaxID=468911 RepID=UPI0039EC29FE